MQLRHQGAKRSMPKQNSSNRSWRPDLDLLEDRWVLSGGITVIGISPPPAIIGGVEFGQSVPQLDPPRFSSVLPPWEGPAPGLERLVGFHHEPGPQGNLFLFEGFQGYLGVQFANPLGGTPGPAEFRGDRSVLLTAPPPDLPHPDSLASTVPPPPIYMMGSPDVSMPRMIQKVKCRSGNAARA